MPPRTIALRPPLWARVDRLRRGFSAGRANALTPVVVSALLITVVYLSTLMWSITGCGAEYCVDVGEFQVALAVGGTVHPTGYPLYMLLGSPFVSALRALGVAPAAGASLYSLVWETAAVAGAALLITRLTHNGVLAVAGAALFGVFEPIWVHGSLAEVYSLSMLFTVAVVGLAIYLGNHWSERGGWLLAFVAGLGVAHHRLLAVVLPAIGFYLLPNAWRGGRFARWLAVACLCFVAGFLPYIDLPVRASHGSTWNYGQPNTWAGFWSIFWAGEYTGQEQPLIHAPDLIAAARDVARTLLAIMTWPGLVGAAVAATLPLVARPTRALAALLWGGMLSYVVFAVVFRRAVLMQAALMPVLMLVVLLGSLGVGRLGSLGQWTGISLIAVWALWLAHQNYPLVASLAHDSSNVDYTQQVEQLEAPPGAVVMAPWGGRYFALAYAQRVSGQLPRWTIVDHRADLATLAVGTGGIYTDAGTPFVFGLDWWTQHLGSPLRLTSAGPNMIELTSRPLPAPSHPPVPIGDGIGIEGCEVRITRQGQRLQVVLYWTAQHVVQTSYSTYVYASDRDAIVTPDDLLAQSDSAVPVDGWYPTTRWQAGEVIREDHLIEIPTARPVRALFAGMYAHDAGGNFIQLGRVSLLHLVDGECTPRL